jgi:predicted lipid-binding transport protein (Tim44 family)
MRRSRSLIAAVLLAAVLAFAPGLAIARAGSGFSFGSSGSRTYSTVPGTGTSPYGAMPMQRSLTPQQAPSYGASPGFARPGYGYGGRSPFMSGLMGGLIGAGIGGLLFGHGMFGGGGLGFGGVFGMLLQFFLIALLVRWLYRRFIGQPALAGAGMSARMGMGGAARPGMPLSGAAAGRAIQITPADYQAFEQLLQAVQAAWSGHDLNTLRAIATPEMVSYFAEQLGEQTSRGVRNMVGSVRLEKGEAWAEGGRDYARVAMHFSMVDVTRDAAGRVVDGSLVERTSATEVWTFLRVPGGRWVLSAIQQAR